MTISSKTRNLVEQTYIDNPPIHRNQIKSLKFSFRIRTRNNGNGCVRPAQPVSIDRRPGTGTAGRKEGDPMKKKRGRTHTHTYPYRRSVERRVISSREHAGVNKPGTPVGLRSPSSSHQRASSPRSFAFRIDAASPDTAHDLSATGLTQLRAGFAETVWLNDSLNWAVI